MKIDTIGQRIKYARFIAEMTQKEVSTQLGKGAVNARISQWERGTRRISLEDVIRLSKILNCNRRWLAFGEGVMPRPLQPGE